jgi:hypothetical protein
MRAQKIMILAPRADNSLAIAEDREIPLPVVKAEAGSRQ